MQINAVMVTLIAKTATAMANARLPQKERYSTSSKRRKGKKMQDRFIKKLWHTNRKCFIEEFSILQTINSEGNFEHTYFEKSPKGELSRLSTCQIKEVLCTGSKDKTGKLIFEGDIITSACSLSNDLFEAKPIGEIIIGRAGFEIEGRGIAYNALQVLDSEKAFKIIGNIYENPELLSN